MKLDVHFHEPRYARGDQEVGPRDGLQSVKSTMATADKCRWIDALVAAGVREIEVASFVPPSLLPQMAHAAEVVRHALRHPGVTVMALVPNRRGAENALKAGVHQLTMPVSASSAHSLANVRKTPQEMVEEVRANAPVADLCEPQGLSDRHLRAPHGARRSGADHGRAGLHDRRRGADCAGWAWMPSPGPAMPGSKPWLGK